MELGATGSGHFDNVDDIRANSLAKDYEPDIRVCFELARKAADEHGVSFFNLTPVSLLSSDIIPRITLSDALELLREC